MQYLVAINQTKALEWGLNAQQAMLFAFLHQVPTWADARQIGGQTFYNVAKTKIVAELPLLTDKADTAYRLMKQLAGFGVIEITSCDNRTYIRLTAKGKTWNRGAGSEKYPNPDHVGDSKGSEKYPTSEESPSGVGKISEPGSEKSPTNQGTNDHNPNTHTAGPDALFDYSQLADDGQPLTGGARQFPMTLDWQPDPEQFAAACLRAGLRSDTQPPAAQLANFTAHHADFPNRRHGSMSWTQKLVDWIRRDLSQSHTKPTGGAANAKGRQRTPSRCLTPAEARERDRQRRGESSGECYEGQLQRNEH
ncbi:DnaT-like ssDNA-binding domain-containing protein [Salinicola sp. CPA57]|uniref:DnaT-like ssDNA-binding domain-containing protein n=1 Tax=Salinicola sp. CPA57 TaxID=1949080 RepID=UPI000DA1C681|nr:DnaT-like ssDNA-binding domain-containing protein [Salinicola sp. CPA57]